MNSSLGELSQERGLVLQHRMLREFIGETGQPEASHAVIGAAGGVAECTGDIALANARRPRK